jgi:hypothetical protein
VRPTKEGTRLALVCTACDGHNRAGSRFCRFCGATLTLRCARCSTVLERDSHFCDNCGTPVPTLGSSAKPAADLEQPVAGTAEPEPDSVWVIEAEPEAKAEPELEPDPVAELEPVVVEPDPVPVDAAMPEAEPEPERKPEAEPDPVEPKTSSDKARLRSVQPTETGSRGAPAMDTGAPWSPENLASRVAEKVRLRLLEHDWDAFVAAQSPEVLVEDRRASLEYNGVGRDAAMKRAAEYTAKDVHVSTTRLATWGTRLGLDKHVLTRGKKGRNATESLVLYEVDQSGYIVYTAFFGGSDLAEAMRAMSERYVAGEGRDSAEVLDAQRLMDIAYSNHDWKAFAKLHDTHVAFVDHLPSGAGSITGRAQVVAHRRSLIETESLDQRVVTTEILANEPDRTLTRVRFAGGGLAERSPVQMEMLNLAVWRKGRLMRLEHFAVAQLDEALERFQSTSDNTMPPVAQHDAPKQVPVLERRETAGSQPAWWASA